MIENGLAGLGTGEQDHSSLATRPQISTHFATGIFPRRFWFEFCVIAEAESMHAVTCLTHLQTRAAS